MGKKIVYIVGIVGCVVITYIIMLAAQPAVNTIINSANASANWSASPDFAMAQGAMNSFMLWQWALPGGIGLIAVAMVIKSKEII